MPASGVVTTQLTTWSLALGALLCTGVTIESSNRSTEASFPCILSATVCLIAAGHYMLLVQVRSNTLSNNALKILAKMTRLSYTEVSAAETLGSVDVSVLEDKFKTINPHNEIAQRSMQKYQKYNLARADLVDFLSDMIRFSDWVS